MEQIVIIHKNGDILPLLSKSNLITVTKAAQKTALLSEDKVAITVQAAMPMHLYIGDEAVIHGKRYRLNQLPQVTKDGERRFTYEITLEGAQYELLDIDYQLTEDSYGENFYADLKGHLDILLWNIQRVMPNKWKLGAYPTETEFKNITTNDKNCLQVLQELCTSYGVEFETVCSDGKVNTLNIKEKVGESINLTLRYGRGRGLYQLQRSTVNNSSIINRLYVYGSSDNLPEGYNHTKLRLPSSTRLTSYVEDAASIAAYGVKEGRKTYDNIKPERVGTITAVGADKLTFVDSSMDFDLNEKKEDGSTRYLIADTAAKIKFETGQLAGYEFDLHSYDHATKTFVINAFTDENKTVFPSDGETFRFAKGDKYAIFDINLPQSYVDNAQNRLKEEALKELPTVSQPQVTYKLQLSEDFLIKVFGKEQVTIFHVGDYLHVIDEQVGVDKEVRIVSLERNCLKLHTYDITLSDTVQRSTTVKVINDVEALNEVIRINNLADPNKARANWKSSREVLDMVFDQDGDYYTDKIKPLSIDTTMLSVGAKASQFCLLGTTIAANYGGDANKVQVTGGILQHYTISEDGVRSWTLADVEVTLGDATKAYYIYARCNREDSEGAVVFSTEQHAVEGDASYYYFLFGIINSKDTTLNVRTVYLTYGFTTINGRFVRTGRIESSGGGSCYFDLDNNEIGGVIKFVNSKGEYVNVADVEALAADTDKYINSTLQSILGGFATQIDGKIETYYTTVDPSATWKTDAERAKHVGDLWFNTETKESKRYSESYAWVIIEDKDAIDALEAAANAQDTADGKRRVFVAQPTTPYDIGDLWVQGDAGDIMRSNKTRLTGSFVASDWVKASKYTGDENLNAYKDSMTANLNAIESKLDGKVETWYQESDPSLEWSQDEKPKHVGDMWYKTDTNESFRYLSDLSWGTITDKDAIDALAAASHAQDTADGKRRVFTATPYAPYDVGDLWVQGATGDIMRCTKARAAGASPVYLASEWAKASKYTGDESLNNFIASYNETIADIYAQLDGVIETWFNNGTPTLDNAPANEWTTPQLKEQHLGDIYYNNDDGKGYRFSKEGTTYKWVEITDSALAEALAAAKNAQDTADGKRRVFTNTPYTPYDEGDLWASGTFLKRCINSRASGNYTASDWDDATNYTGDESLNAFIDGVFASAISEIYTQIDGKIECWYTTTNPATAWTTAEERAKHVGDQWYNTSSKLLYRYAKVGSGYAWQEITNKRAIDAAAAAAAAQDTADEKRRVFTAQPYPPYDVGDLWTDGADLYRCETARASGSFVASDWGLATDYTNDESLNSFIDGVFADSMEEVLSQIDGKIECWYTPSDPSNGWDYEDFVKHVGDQWYNTSSRRLYRLTYSRQKGFTWEEITNQDAIEAAAAAAAAQDTADGKRRVFVDTPYPPYDVGDLWTDGKDLFRCNNARQEGEYVASDWGKATSYTDDSSLLNFLQNVYLPDKHAAEEQLDGKIETWFTTTDPSVNWLSNEEKYKHNGDLWYNVNTKTLKRWGMTRTWRQNAQGLGFYIYGVGKWADIEDQKAIDAYAAAAAAQDTADGKRQVFVDTPYPPYDIGDLWLTGGATDGQLKRCVTAKAEGEEYNANDWVIAVYYDNTKTTIDGGIVTSGTVQLAGSNQSIKAGITGEGTDDSSVRVWAGASKENRATAPFRVLQNGELYATKAHIEGEINATSGKFSGEVNATSGTFYGSLATPPKAIPDNTTTLVLDFKEGFNFAGTLTGSSNVKTIQLPMDAKYAGVQCSIINYGSSSNGCFRVRASSSSYPLLYSGRLSNRRTVNYVDLYGCAEIRLKAITVSGNVRWFIENHLEFSYDVQNQCLRNNMPSSIMRVIGSYWVNSRGNITNRMCADNNPVEWVGYTGDGCFRFKFKKQRTSGLDYTLVVRNEGATNVPYRITEKGDTYFTISLYFQYATAFGITQMFVEQGGWGFDILEYDK